MTGAPSSAPVVIIGGGIGGVSAAYHLAKLGVEGVLMLERAELSSGTTWHSTGNMETYRADPLIFDMVRYAAALYPQIAAECGRDIGWRVVGRVMYTDREERWAHMRTLPELGRARGIEIEALSPAEIGSRLPIIALDELIGGAWIPSDARVNPTDAVSALAHLARARGAVIRERCAVLGIDVRNEAVCGVTTAQGKIDCETVVIAGGLWSGDIAGTCGARLPLHALEHQYLITRPFGVDRNLPLFLSFDDQLYGREEVGGLIVGSLDDHAIPIGTHELPQNFASCLLSERWDQFEPYMTTAIRRFPALRAAPLKMLLNGPESFTPDGQMLLGPVPGVNGLFAACGFNSNGMALAPAAGRYIAEWIVEGAPSADVAALDVRRFSRVQSETAYVRERATEIPGYHCRIHSADHDYRTSRNVRRSPLYADLEAGGAVFISVNGWERAAWLRAPSADDWLDAVSEETRAAAAGGLLVDRSSDVKYLLSGEGVGDWLDEHAPALFPGEETQVRLVPLPGRNGEVEALPRAVESQRDRCLLTAAPDQETRLGEWLRQRLPVRFRASDRTLELACIEVRGASRSELVQQATLGKEDAHFIVRADTLNDSTLITCDWGSGTRFWRRLRALGFRMGGHFAEEAVRIARGIPAFGREITGASRVGELTGELRGSRILAAFATPIPRMGTFARDVILSNGRVVGELTSRMRLPGWDSALGLGRIDVQDANMTSLETVADGKTWPLTQRESAWENARRSLSE